jgi:hypothetical protein
MRTREHAARVFLPYAQDQSGYTLYQLMRKEKFLALLPAKEEQKGKGEGNLRAYRRMKPDGGRKMDTKGQSTSSEFLKQ